jgi:hypothetical protein
VIIIYNHDCWFFFFFKVTIIQTPRTAPALTSFKDTKGTKVKSFEIGISTMKKWKKLQNNVRNNSQI